jgi:flagellar motility protein MotE (MotC chaperone)
LPKTPDDSSNDKDVKQKTPTSESQQNNEIELTQQAAGGGSDTTPAQDQPQSAVKTFRPIEHNNPKDKLRFDAQAKKDKKVLKQDIKEQRNKYKQLKKEYDKQHKKHSDLTNQIAKIDNAITDAKNSGKNRVTVGFSSMSIQEAQEKIEQLRDEMKELGKQFPALEVELQKQAIKCLESYNLYKVLDGKEDEQVFCDSNAYAKNVMDQTLENNSYSANVGNNIRNIDQSVLTERQKVLETERASAFKVGTLAQQRVVQQGKSPSSTPVNDNKPKGLSQ